MTIFLPAVLLMLILLIGQPPQSRFPTNTDVVSVISKKQSFFFLSLRFVRVRGLTARSKKSPPGERQPGREKDGRGWDAPPDNHTCDFHVVSQPFIEPTSSDNAATVAHRASEGGLGLDPLGTGVDEQMLGLGFFGPGWHQSPMEQRPFGASRLRGCANG